MPQINPRRGAPSSLALRLAAAFSAALGLDGDPLGALCEGLGLLHSAADGEAKGKAFLVGMLVHRYQRRDVHAFLWAVGGTLVYYTAAILVFFLICNLLGHR